MKLVIQKTKKVMRLRLYNWVIGLVAFAGILVILLFLMTGIAIPPSLLLSAKICTAFFTLVFTVSFFYEYFAANRISNALSNLTKSITQVEDDLSVSLESQDESFYITAISNILNRSVLSLNEKNQKLKSEIERNQRLSENISEFYRQMKILRETDFKFDFFEYDLHHGIFIFITGLVTLLENSDDISEITAEDLFNNFDLSISKEEFDRQVEECVRNNVPLNFECSVISEKGETRWVKFWGRLVEDGTRITGAITDITREARQRNEEKSKATHDNITGFYNRNALSEVGGKAVSESRDGKWVVFVYIGLTGYQEFQERFGMVAGNSYIKAFSEVLRRFIQPNIIPFRWWGSDFLLLVTGVSDLDHIKRELEMTRAKIEKYIGEVEGVAASFPIAVGYSVSGIDGDMPAELLEYASFAAHEAAREVAENPNPYNRERYDEAKRASLRRTFIKDIIDKNQLSIVFQPIISLKTGELFGFEALSRPTNPIYKSIVELIDDAEASGHYGILEKRMVYNALDTYMTRDERFRDQYLFINTAPYATLDEQDYNDIRDRYFGHMKVVFEVVERNRLEPEEINLRKSIVTKAGAKFALDDFGSGYSNHLALLALEPDIIKLDRELVRGINNDLRKQHMIEDIVSYARYRGTRVLAEGVETRDELETLCRMGIDYAQGYFIGRPVPEIDYPDPKAQEIIRAMGKSSRISFRHVFGILLKSMALADEEMSKNAGISSFLVMRMMDKLNMESEKHAGMIAASIMHDIGVFHKEGTDWRNRCGLSIPRHSLFAYLVMKEYFPYSDFAEAVLYHHTRYNDKAEALSNIAIPEEAYLLSFADDAAGLIIGGGEGKPDERDVMARLGEGGHNPLHVKSFGDLVEEGILDSIYSGDYLNDLLNFAGYLRAGRSEIESIIKTFAYAVMFRMPYTYAHARIMETAASLLARLTKQNWKLVEKIRLAALFYNLSRMTITDEEFKRIESVDEENAVVKKALKDITAIMREAGTADITDMLNAVNGDETVSPENHVLMGKDIIIGARVLNIADIFASLLEVRPYRPGLNCSEAIGELARMLEGQTGYSSMIEIMGDYIEDIEGRINSYKAETEKRYRSVIANYHKLKEHGPGAYDSTSIFKHSAMLRQNKA